MTTKNFRRAAWTAAIFFLLFILFTVSVLTLDVKPIGPNGSSVGLATLNETVFSACGASPAWDKISDLAFVLAFLVAGCFALLGMTQLIRRRSLAAVDHDLYVLAGIYALSAVFYVLFEIIPINCRPILVDGLLEASYPSSHAMLTFTIMLTAIPQFCRRLNKPLLRRVLILAAVAICLITAVGRLLSGMHWASDVIGAVLLAAALAALCSAITARITENKGKC